MCTYQTTYNRATRTFRANLPMLYVWIHPMGDLSMLYVWIHPVGDQWFQSQRQLLITRVVPQMNMSLAVSRGWNCQADCLRCQQKTLHDNSNNAYVLSSRAFATTIADRGLRLLNEMSSSLSVPLVRSDWAIFARGRGEGGGGVFIKKKRPKTRRSWGPNIHQ